MKTLFNYDGSLMNVCRKIMYITAANLLFLLCSLPVFTAGASATAMYTLLIQYRQEKNPMILSVFFKAFKENFKKATILWCGMLLILTTLIMNYIFLYHYTGIIMTAIRVALNLILILLTATWIYLFPYIAIYENSCLGYLEYTLATALARLPETVLLFAVWGGMILLLLFLGQFLPLATCVLLLCGFSVPANFTVSRILQKIE